MPATDRIGPVLLRLVGCRAVAHMLRRHRRRSRPPRRRRCTRAIRRPCGCGEEQPQKTYRYGPAPYVVGSVASRGGPVRRVSTVLTGRDRRGARRVRWGMGRGDYRVEPGLYAVGSPDADAPVLVSANYKLSFDTLRAAVDGLSAWLLVVDTRGINVWCAAGKGTFSAAEVNRMVEQTGPGRCRGPSPPGPAAALRVWRGRTRGQEGQRLSRRLRAAACDGPAGVSRRRHEGHAADARRHLRPQRASGARARGALGSRGIPGRWRSTPASSASRPWDAGGLRCGAPSPTARPRSAWCGCPCSAAAWSRRRCCHGCRGGRSPPRAPPSARRWRPAPSSCSARA